MGISLSSDLGSVDCDGIRSSCSWYPCLSTFRTKSCSVLIYCLIWVGVQFPYIESFWITGLIILIGQTRGSIEALG